MNRLFKSEEKWLLKMKNESIKRILPKWLILIKKMYLFCQSPQKSLLEIKKKYFVSLNKMRDETNESVM